MSEARVEYLRRRVEAYRAERLTPHPEQCQSLDWQVISDDGGEWVRARECHRYADHEDDHYFVGSPAVEAYTKGRKMTRFGTRRGFRKRTWWLYDVRGRDIGFWLFGVTVVLHGAPVAMDVRVYGWGQ